MRSDSAATLDRLVARAGQLFSLPVVAMQVLELTNNSQVDPRALKECIENDPALTAKILRVVNSSLFGLSREVSDLNQAIALLGSKPLKLLVLGFSLPVSLFASVESEVLAHYWRHALTKAVAGREISETIWNIPGDEAFIAGLLQDLGLLLLIQQVGEPYVMLLKKVWTNGKDMATVEAEAMGFDHAELSAKLLSQWGLPEAIVEAVGWDPLTRPLFHEEPNAPPLPRIVFLAEMVARLLADNRPQVLSTLMQLGREYRQLTDAKLENLVDNLQDKVKQLADVLSLQLPEGTDYRDILVTAHGRLSAVAQETAETMLTERMNQPASVKEEAALMSEVAGLSEAISILAAPQKKPAPQPAAVSVGGPSAPSPLSKSHNRSLPEAPPTLGARNAPVETAADNSLTLKLEATVASCRISRCAVSLVLVELDRADDLIVTRGVRGFQQLLTILRNACWAAGIPGMDCVAHGEAGFAIILPDCERRKAVEIGGELIRAVNGVAPIGLDRGSRAASLSVGVASVAMPPKNFPPNDLFTSASRCLYGSHASGGGVVKSLEIY
jgi:HD-like signal output (HDOD) protein/GGDEF domain-containing protein